MPYKFLLISLWHYLLYIIHFSDHFERIYAVITTLSLTIQDLSAHLTAMEKQVNHPIRHFGYRRYAAIFPLKSIDEVIAFENCLSQNADEYNKFVS